MNANLSKANTSGAKGVTWDKNSGKWQAKIMVNRKTINIGRYVDKSAAISARQLAERKHFGEYRRAS